MAGTPADWRIVCERAAAAPDAAALREVLTSELRPWSMHDRDRDQGLATGYYEPQLHGSKRRSARFQVPLYVRPPELIEIDLGSFREEYKGKRLAGVVNGNRLVPFADRAGVDGGALAGRDLELVWVDDPIDAFFLHIQGSGRIALDDGTEMRVGYSAQNGHPYVAIGRELVARGALALEDVTMQSIRAWLAANPAEAAAVMQRNPSFIFFRKLDEEGPIGSSGVVLEPYRSVAVDTAFVPLGSVMWVAGSWPSPRVGRGGSTAAAPGRRAGHRRRDPRTAARRSLLRPRRGGGGDRGPPQASVPGVAAPAAQRAAGRDRVEAVGLEARHAAVAVVEAAGIACAARGRSVVYQYAQRMKSAWIGKRSHSALVGASG